MSEWEPFGMERGLASPAALSFRLRVGNVFTVSDKNDFRHECVRAMSKGMPRL